VGTNIYRIRADFDRSEVALTSHLGLPIIDVPQIQIDASLQSERERAARDVHKKVMDIFLQSNADFAVVLEDDAILTSSKEWINFTDFDFFVPFSHNRLHLPIDLKIKHGKLPKYGAFAYLCSRSFAQRYSQELAKPGLADVLSHAAAKGLKFGSYAGNAVNHDNEAKSMISEERRLSFLKKHPNQEPETLLQKLMLKIK
jgi:hypothetical protein